MTDLEFTGERFVPSKSPPRLEAEHRSRYEFAFAYVQDRRTLDIGCGEGYGSYMLIGSAKSVVGVDIDKRAIEHAKEMYGSTNLEYLVADVTKLPFSDNQFNACVCFEVIEHIENPQDLLKEAERVLELSGILVISTPNGAVRVSSKPNPHHVQEFSPREFKGLLESVFPPDRWRTEIYGQFQIGKTYSTARVALKNLYLGVKGSLGIGASEDDSRSVPRGSAASGIKFTFKTENAGLAEYLVAVVTGHE